jgi:tmRNA-binding protein
VRKLLLAQGASSPSCSQGPLIKRLQTIIPLAALLQGSARVKVELALVTHKKQHDKRAAKKTPPTTQREIDRAMLNNRKGK